jgi:hypothetical protein
MTTLFWTKIIVVAAAGALGAALANRGIVLFNDAIRSIVPELMEGRMPRRKFASLVFSSNLGLILAFGIPYSLVSPILLSHALWLGSDVIGSYFPGSFDGEKEPAWRGYWGLCASIICGGLFGVFLVFVLQGITGLIACLPVNFIPAMLNLSSPVIFTLAAIPALAIAYQYGFRHGSIAFVITLLVRQILSGFGQAQPDAWAFLVGMLVLILHAVREARRDVSVERLFVVSAKQVTRLRSYLPWIAILGALYALSTNMGMLMEGPQSLLALAQGNRLVAIDYSIARAISFLPMRTMSMLATGVYTMDGLGFAPVAGLAAPTPLVAAATGAIVMSVEGLGLVFLANLFNRFPSLMNVAISLRTAMTKLLEVASLLGGLIAANSMAPGFGFFAMAGLYTLNEAAGVPIMRLAVGPVFIILIGLLINLLTVLHIR